MKSSSRIAVAVAVFLLVSSTARAAGVDIKDPRRALGREDDIRVDAQMLQETLSPGSPISVTYQIENLTDVADRDRRQSRRRDVRRRLADDHRLDRRGNSQGTAMPHLTTIAPGQTRAFRIGASAQVLVAECEESVGACAALRADRRQRPARSQAVREPHRAAGEVRRRASAAERSLRHVGGQRFVGRIECASRPLEQRAAGSDGGDGATGILSRQEGGYLRFSRARIVQRDTLRARKAGSHAWQASAAEEEMLMASKVFVGNLDFNTTRDEVEALFAQVGTVRDVFLPTDRESGRPRGFAFVEFESDEDAAKAIEKFNGHDLGGRALRVNAAEDRPPRAGGGGGGRSFGGRRRWTRRLQRWRRWLVVRRRWRRLRWWRWRRLRRRRWWWQYGGGGGGGAYGGGGGKPKGSRRNIRAKKRGPLEMGLPSRRP